MSWEHTKYDAVCEACGRKGFVIRSSDDWGRFATSYEGFDNVSPDATAVGRKRADARDSSPKCACGSTAVRQGAWVK